MSTARQISRLSVENYLAAELNSPVKHEYLGGVVYAMAGGRNAHNIISGNCYAALHNRFRGKPCRPFNSATKIRVLLPGGVRFYYPDVSIICRANPQTESFQDEPAVIFEVFSNRTRRIDEGEKKDAYLSIPSLSVYVMVEQEIAAVVVYRRIETGFDREVYQGLEAVLPLGEIGIDLALAEIYEGVEFVPEAEVETL
jgi:Uma2 family endonuclease